ncbi:acyl-CoA dehydrogenase family protein [Streptomyces sp. NPDC006368]|uniref:acyl-CoA dehydrogenase family protein n=1 Tax=Streptomyces sp. NPDC006368 TaxID=3156760 RepID=UPI0033B70C2A
MTTRLLPADPGSGPGLKEAVRDVVPVIRKYGIEAEEGGRVPRETLRLLDNAGAFRMSVPERFGGLGLSVAEQAEVVREIARGCPSTGWNMTVWLTGALMAGLYPDEVQKEVFAGGSVRVSIGFAPTGRLTPVEGGYRLTGRWNYNSGCHAADWDCVAAMLEHPDGTEEEFFVLVPLRDLTIVDDWDVSAGRGTGSATTVAEDVFVPARRLATYEGITLGTTGDRWNEKEAGRGYGVVAFIMSMYAAMALGTATGAYELFLERVPGRGITYTNWEEQRDHPLIQQRVATAANKIEAGSALLEQVLALLQRRADAPEQPTTEEKAVVRGRTAFAATLAKEAVELLHSTSGASVIKRDVPFQRYHRDILGFSLHALAQIHTNLEVQGRVLLGLDPGTDIL